MRHNNVIRLGLYRFYGRNWAPGAYTGKRVRRRPRHAARLGDKTCGLEEGGVSDTRYHVHLPAGASLD